MDVLWQILKVAIVVMSSFCIGVSIVVLCTFTAFKASRHVVPAASGFTIISIVASVRVYSGSMDSQPGWLLPVAVGFGLAAYGLIALLRSKVYP